MNTIKNVRAKLLILLFATTAIYPLFAQPEIGKSLPDFTLENIRNYDKSSFSNFDVCQKWLVIDFWAITCRACIDGFPKLNEIQNQLKDDLQVVLVGYTGGLYNKGIEKVYDRVEKRLQLNLAIAFDSTLAMDWNVRSVPHILIVDPSGTVRAITGGRDLTLEKMKSMIHGESTTFYPIRTNRASFTIERVLGSQIGRDGIVNISVLTKWNGEAQSSGYDIDRFESFPSEIQRRGWSVSMLPLFELYNYAYFGRAFWLPGDTTFYGKICSMPAIEVQDPSPFEYDYINDVGKNTFNYLFYCPLPAMSSNKIMASLQRALYCAFGYAVSIEERISPVWNLNVIDSVAVKKIYSNGDTRYFSGHNAIVGFTVRNYSVQEFLNLLTCNLENNDRIPFIDNTGIHQVIDFSIDVDMTDYKSIQKVLNMHGLSLTRGERKMTTLVIKD